MVVHSVRESFLQEPQVRAEVGEGDLLRELGGQGSVWPGPSPAPQGAGGVVQRGRVSAGRRLPRVDVLVAVPTHLRTGR